MHPRREKSGESCNNCEDNKKAKNQLRSLASVRSKQIAVPKLRGTSFTSFGKPKPKIIIATLGSRDVNEQVQAGEYLPSQSRFLSEKETTECLLSVEFLIFEVNFERNF